MTRMIFVRHGESVGNSERRFYGNFDKGLSELGKLQANRTGEHLKDTEIHAAYASDLGRAYDTGLRVAAFHKGLEVIPCEGLREIYAGEWENMLFSEIETVYAEDYSVWRNDIWNSTPTGGEPVKVLCERVKKAVWEIADANVGKTVLLALHATPIRTLECEWLGEAYENMKNHPWVKNASVSIVDYDTEKRTVTPIVIGEIDFMGDLSTGLPKNV